MRRGKYLWLPLDDSPFSVLAHLGMSGQLLVQPQDAPDEKHLRIRIRFDDTRTPAPAGAEGTELRFVDQRTFGGLSLHETPGMVCRTSSRTSPATRWTPSSTTRPSTRPARPAYDDQARPARPVADERVGNIVADEALWRAKLHYERPVAGFTRPRTAELLGHIRDVMNEALAVGGTSFDSLYVNVNGESGYFDRSLDAYGREGEPCRRCGTPMRRRAWMNRSSYFCPRCQRPPRVTP